MNKKNIFIIVFLFVLFGSAFVQYKNILPKKSVVVPLFISSRQTVVINGVKNTKVERSKVGTTALQLLTSTHTVLTKGEKVNAFVTSIDGRIADSSQREFWAFYINGKQSSVGAGSYSVKNNDTIEWKIETY